MFARLRQALDSLQADVRADQQRSKQREQLKQRRKRLPPWTCANESMQKELKRRILALSADERLFLDKPGSNDVEMDMEVAAGYAEVALQQDLNLQALRYQLVPSRVSDDVFFRKYFSAVAEIRQLLGVYPLQLVDLPLPEFGESVESHELQTLDREAIAESTTEASLEKTES